MASSIMEARLARLRAVIKDDLERLPDLPPKPEPKPATSSPAPAPKVYGPPRPPAKSQEKPANIIWPEAQSDSDDSETDCRMEFIRVKEDEGQIGKLEEDDSSEDDNILPTIKKVTQSKLAKGQLAPQGQGFAAILGFSKFPYKYITKDGGEDEKVADRFFNAGKFFMREWDLYYIWPIDYSDKPLILITEEQFVRMVKEISAQFPHLYINPKDPWFLEVGLTCDFSIFKHPRFLPRYLGRCSSKAQYDNMIDQAPSAEFTRKDDPIPKKAPDDRSREAFRAMVENSIAANKAKNKAGKNLRRVARVEKQKDMGKQLKRAQRYLGVRPRKELVEDQDIAAIPAIEPSEPAPYPFENSPVFICIDVEAYERSNKIITEIGVATLDTLDLVGISPGVSGKNWQSKIRARHFRIKEHTSYRNGEFVSDAADQFEFGKSEFIPLKEAPAAIASCFKPPFSKPDGAETPEGGEKRNIIFVAHDVNSDIQFLRQVGYDPLNLSNLLETLDTAQLYRAHKRDPNAKSVGNTLYEFDFTGWNLHNAGNDAVYTMWIMLATCVREACGRGKTETELERMKKLEEDIKAAEDKARAVVLEDQAAWVEGDGEMEDDDGGIPVKV